MKRTHLLLGASILVFLALAFASSAETDPDCKKLGSICSTPTDCCPTYMTSQGFFQGYCGRIGSGTGYPFSDNHGGTQATCRAADGLEGRLSALDLCKRLYDSGGNPINIGFTYTYGGNIYTLQDYYEKGHIGEWFEQPTGYWLYVGDHSEWICDWYDYQWNVECEFDTSMENDTRWTWIDIPPEDLVETNFLGFDVEKTREVRSQMSSSYTAHFCEYVYQGLSGSWESIYGNFMGNPSPFTYYYDLDDQLVRIRVEGEDYETRQVDTFGFGKAAYAVDSAVSGKVVTAIDPGGNVRQKKLSNGVTINYVYDALHRLRNISASGGSVAPESVVYEYPSYNRQTKEVYDTCADGYSPNRLCKVTDGSGSTEFYYDLRGRVKWKRITIQDSPMEHVFQLTYSYNDDNTIKEITLPDGHSISYVYDALGRLSDIMYDKEKIATIEYNPTGTVAGRVLNPEGGAEERITTGYWYDDREWVRGIAYYQDNQQIFGRGLRYDDAGNIEGIADYVDPSNPLAYQTGHEIETYAYDELNRLTDANYLDEGTSFNYQYRNLLGDRFSMTTNAASLASATYTYEGWLLDEVREEGNTIDYNYDEAGNVVEIMEDEVKKTLTYDALGRLASVSSPAGTETYEYDYTNKRVKKTDSTGTTFYVYQGNQVIYELKLPADFSYGECGNGLCETDETCSTCSADCGTCVDDSCDDYKYNKLTGGWEFVSCEDGSLTDAIT